MKEEEECGMKEEIEWARRQNNNQKNNKWSKNKNETKLKMKEAYDKSRWRRK